MSSWGIDPQEQLLPFPCDNYLTDFDGVLYRGVTIKAPASIIFRWLCQMSIAPYSYDWIDNRGHQSPRTLTPGLDQLGIGQKIMGFPVVEFEPGRHITAGGESKRLGKFYLTYLIVPKAPDRCRLLVKILARYQKTPVGLLLRLFLPWGDLVMMRRQLLNFKTLSEQIPMSESHRQPDREVA